MEDLNKKIEEAEKALKYLKDKRDFELKNNVSWIKKLDDFTTEEKIEFFDDIYNFMYSIVEDNLNGDWHEDNDNHGHLYETVAPILAKDSKTFWKSYNKFFE